MATAKLTFLPWVRQGAVTAISEVDTLQAGMRGAVDLQATLNVNGAPAASLSVRLRGPADVVGIDPHEIVRMDPRPGTRDFEPNYFPCVEFDRPDFPWLFTPARADARGRLRPWLCLVVVRVQDGVTLGGVVDGKLPVLDIRAPAHPADELPDLADSWAWVHAQTVGDRQNARDALSARPDLSLSRLLCPRLLAPDTDYIACLVPAFSIGRKSGLGESVSAADIAGLNALAPAWPSENRPAAIMLPVYHSWAFRTGANVDFESLVMRLRAGHAPERLGLRPVDISHPGFRLPSGFPAGAALDVEGALQPIERPDSPEPWNPAAATPFQGELGKIVNGPANVAAANPADDPLLAPPLYGHYYAARATVAPGPSPTWLDDLNLDPRNRIVAAFGTSVVQKHQEALMAAAWEQVGDLQQANERVRRLQLSLAVNASLHARHFARLDDEGLLRVSAPAFARIRRPAGETAFTAPTLLATVRESAVPVNAVSGPMRRTARKRGPFSRRADRQGTPRPATRNWVRILNMVAPVTPEPSRFDLATFAAVRRRLPPGVRLRSYSEVIAEAVVATPGRPTFEIQAENERVGVPPAQDLPASADNPVASAFRLAAQVHLERLNPGRLSFLVAPPPSLRMDEIRGAVLGQMRPLDRIRTFARAVIGVGAGATPVVADAPDATGLDTIMAAPSFPRPMYECLRELGQELLLPGLEDIPANTVVGLKTNPRFVEAYMVGLNAEMARELLWRGFPTDERGTYFVHFWDARAAASVRPDIEPIHRWQNRRLGTPAGAPPREKFVLLIRSDLLRRYPTVVIYATPARVVNGVRLPSDDPAQESYPVFRGSMEPDVTFFGFDVSADDMVRGNNGLGHYIVVQQQPTEPRFGLDVGTPVAPQMHLRMSDGAPAGLASNGLEWGRNGAHMAGMTRQLPVRIAIHSSKFVRG